MGKFQRAPLLLCLALSLCLATVRSASEECVNLVPTLVESCPAFEFAKVNDLSLKTGEPLVKAQDGQLGAPLIQAFDKIMAQSFDEQCCDLMQKLNASRCFCQQDVVEVLESDMEEELLAFTIFTAAGPTPRGCGGSIWAALDSDQCLPLGPMSDNAGDSAVTRQCNKLSTLLRDPRSIQQSINLFEEALDATGLISEVENLAAITIFAPTDSAFTNFAEDQGITISQLLANTKMLSSILQQHVVLDAVINLSDIDSTSQFPTLEGQELTLEKLPSGGLAVEGSPVSQADIPICNGVMHIVPAVLVGSLDLDPEAATTIEGPTRKASKTANTTNETDEAVMGASAKEEDCKSLLKLLVSFEEAFGVLVDEIEKVDDVKTVLQGTGPLTVFAPINSALEIEKMVNGEKSVEDSKETLERLIVEGDVEGSSLKPGTRLVTIGGEEIEAAVEGGTILINGVKIVEADIEACNGRLFIIEGPLPPLPSTPEEPASKVKTKTPVSKPLKPAAAQKKPSSPRKVGTTPKMEPEPKKEGPTRPTATPEPPTEGNAVSLPDKNVTTPAEEPSSKSPAMEVKDEKPAAGITVVSKPMETDSINPCGCSTTGVTVGVETNRRGCGQHLIDFGDGTLFCYVEDPEACEATNQVIDLFPSIKFAPGVWRECEESEVADLPTLAELLGTKLESLHPVWTLFSHANLRDVLQDDSPLTVFVPSRLAVANLLSSGELDGNSPNAEELQAILQNHIVKGRFTEEDLGSEDSVTTLGGGVLRIRTDETGSLLIGDTASIELPNMLASNGVAHIVDEIISEEATQERTVSLAKACSCSFDDFSGDIYTGRPGCGIHIPGEAPFCYVQHPDECHLATESKAFLGAKWMPCHDPCSCSKDGVSGTVSTGRPGCARHVIGQPPFCYVVGPDKCKRSSPSELYGGAAWKWCDSYPEWPILTFGRLNTVPEDPCSCSEDGVSGGVMTGRPGCGKFGVLMAPFRVCYVKQPSSCPIALPSMRTPGAGWRIC